jgi:hypothetical protein
MGRLKMACGRIPCYDGEDSRAWMPVQSFPSSRLGACLLKDIV